MSTSSEYYRSAHPHSHYQNFPSGAHEQDYADYLRTWQDTSHASYTGPSSVPLNLAHYPQPGLGSDYARPQQPHVQQTWNASYAPPDVQVQQWNACVNEQTFAPRLSAPYDIVEGGASVQHSAPNVARPYPHQHHQQPATATHEQPLTSPDHTFRDTDRFTALRITSESPATPADPPFAHHGHRAHSIAHTAQLAVSEPTAEQTHAALQPSNVWGPAPALAPTDHQHYVSHTDSALSSGMLTSGSISIQTDQWPTTSAAVAVVPAPPFYGHVHIQQQQQWPALPAITDLTVYEHEGAQTEISSDPYAQNIRRTGGKKKIAKVPSSYVERQEKMKVSRRKGPLLEKQREKTHTMRKTKRICVRCRFYKSGCDEGDPCQKCSKIEGHARSFREPCYREHLEDTSIIRRCNGREQQDEAEFLGYDWQPGSELWNMDILWNLPGFGRIPNAQPMRVSFRPYTPRRGSLDTATSLWSTKEGGVCAIEQPAYAVYDTATLVNSFEGYFGGLQSHIETWIYDRIQNDEIAMQTYQEVFRMRKVHRSKTLDLAMKLQCLSIVSQGYGTVYSNDIPGIQEYDYRRLGPSDYEAYDRNSRDRPLPGAITHQMDVAAVKHLRKLEKEFVKELARLIFKPKIKPWYELFLTFYVIFWNLEYINQGAKGYMKAKNGTIVEHQVNNVVSNQVKKWEFAFPVLLYHWRCTLRGYLPFKLARDNPEELRERGHIDAEGFAYITKITEIFDRRSADRFQPPLTGFSAMHHSFASEWITQLFKEAGA